MTTSGAGGNRAIQPKIRGGCDYNFRVIPPRVRKSLLADVVGAQFDGRDNASSFW